MTEITVGKNDGGKRIDRFLTKLYPSLNESAVCKMARKKQLKLNGKRCEPNTRINEGDIIRLFIDAALLEKRRSGYEKGISSDIDVVYEDGNILLVNKPVGMVVHEDDSGETDTLINRIKSYLYEKGDYSPENEATFAPSLCNRIDRNTSGIVIAAKTARALQILNQKLRDREIKKLYLCLAAGKPQPQSAVLTAYLKKDADKNTVRITDKKAPDNLTIKTKYRTVGYDGENSLLLVELLTGRTHQIRAHFAYIGHPLIGDSKYGDNKLNRRYKMKYQALCSYKLIFDFSTDAGELEYLNKKEFSIPLPDFAKNFGGRTTL